MTTQIAQPVTTTAGGLQQTTAFPSQGVGMNNMGGDYGYDQAPPQGNLTKKEYKRMYGHKPPKQRYSGYGQQGFGQGYPMGQQGLGMQQGMGPVVSSQTVASPAVTGVAVAPVATGLGMQQGLGNNLGLQQGLGAGQMAPNGLPLLGHHHVEGGGLFHRNRGNRGMNNMGYGYGNGMGMGYGNMYGMPAYGNGMGMGMGMGVPLGGMNGLGMGYNSAIGMPVGGMGYGSGLGGYGGNMGYGSGLGGNMGYGQGLGGYGNGFGQRGLNQHQHGQHQHGQHQHGQHQHGQHQHGQHQHKHQHGDQHQHHTGPHHHEHGGAGHHAHHSGDFDHHQHGGQHQHHTGAHHHEHGGMGHHAHHSGMGGFGNTGGFGVNRGLGGGMGGFGNNGMGLGMGAAGIDEGRFVKLPHYGRINENPNIDNSTLWRPRADIFDVDQDHLRVEFELPGVPREDISLTIQENILTLAALKPQTRKEEVGFHYQNERHFGKFYRRMMLPFSVDATKIKAHMDNGVLKVHLVRLPGVSGGRIPIAEGLLGQQTGLNTGLNTSTGLGQTTGLNTTGLGQTTGLGTSTGTTSGLTGIPTTPVVSTTTVGATGLNTSSGVATRT